MHDADTKKLADAKSGQGVLPDSGFLRIHQIIAPLGPIPVGRSTWWKAVSDGRFPKPVKLGPRITAWRKSDIQELIEALSEPSKPRHDKCSADAPSKLDFCPTHDEAPPGDTC